MSSFPTRTIARYSFASLFMLSNNDFIWREIAVFMKCHVVKTAFNSEQWAVITVSPLHRETFLLSKRRKSCYPIVDLRGDFFLQMESVQCRVSHQIISQHLFPWNSPWRVVRVPKLDLLTFQKAGAAEMHCGARKVPCDLKNGPLKIRLLWKMATGRA